MPTAEFKDFASLGKRRGLDHCYGDDCLAHYDLEQSRILINALPILDFELERVYSLKMCAEAKCELKTWDQSINGIGRVGI